MFLSVAVPGWAEYNSTNLFDGTTTNFGGAYFLPNVSPGTNNYLIIINGGSVTNTTAQIGLGAADHTNFVFVSGTNSIWENTGSLTIGQNGSGNQMIITNGGRVNSTIGRLGNAGSGNFALITGSNSLWFMSADFQVGDSGKNNQLTIANGGRVVDTIGYIGSVNSSNATVLVTDPGSVWSNTSTLNAGYAGNYSRLIITNGGLVYNGAGQIGAFGGASNNSVIVTGVGSIWRNIGSLTLGAVANAGNGRLTISDGAQVINTAGNIGAAGGSGNNLVTVTGSGSVWSNTSTLNVGSSGANNRLIITNGGRVVVGSAITIGSANTNNQLVVADGGGVLSSGLIMGSLAGNDYNTATVTGNGSTWTNTSFFTVGSASSFNTLTVSDGGRIVTGSGAVNIGNAITSSNNVVTVTGSGSVFTNGSDVNVGGFGRGNQLIISNGGTFYSGGAGKIGAATTSTNNQAVVTGTNSVWNYVAGTSFSVGYGGYSNQLFVLDGGRVIGNATSYIGGDTGLGGNLAVVSGTGSVWNTGVGGLNLGWASGQNQLVVTNGGNVTVSGLILSALGTSFSNRVVVTGAGSTLTNSGATTIGSVNGYNQFTISDNARVTGSGAAIIGSAHASSNNVVTVTGGGVWSNANTLTVGSLGGFNQLNITNGGKVFSSTASIGAVVTSTNNQVLVSGPGSLWNYVPGTSFQVGSDGFSNQLVVADGGQVIGNSASYIGGNGGKGGNMAIVTGTGSVWNTGAGGLTMGWVSGENKLLVTNGGNVTVSSFVMSGFGASPSNSVVVTGAGSTITNSGTTTIGSTSGFNKQTISDGGKVIGTGVAVIGPTTGTNIATVTGPNSVWTNSNFLYVGQSGSGNQLVISNGGKVYSTFGLVSLSGNNNTAIVTGSNSLWKTSGHIQVGDSGRLNQLTISDGGQVSTVHAYIGSTSSQSNTVLITGAGSTWDVNNNVFYAGYAGSAAFLTITNGGRLSTFQTVVGYLGSSLNNRTVVTGPGSILQNNDALFVGANSTGLGSGNVLVTDGGTIEAQRLFSGTSGSGHITNRGGVYQFTTATPTVTANTAGSILITNGTISYRAVATANIFDPQVANMTFQGDNTFQLNNASNATGLATYKFDSVANTGTPTNYQRLALVNTGSVWRSTALTIGTGGALFASNATATVAASLVSSGSVLVVNSKITYASNVVIHGSYVSDPSTNTFLNDVTIGQSGSLAGGMGDLFDFKKSLFINSTNKTMFDLDASAVMFSGGGMHTNAITGQDFGTNDLGYAQNFAYGELHLGSAADQICFTCGNIPTVASNGLYIGWLDLLGNAALVTNLHAASGINLYYDKTDTRNAYLGGLTYGLTDCDFSPGGGSLIALIPEPSALMLSALGAMGLLLRRMRSRHRGVRE